MTELPLDLADEIAIVTSGGTGIGKAIALALASRGATVVSPAVGLITLRPR